MKRFGRHGHSKETTVCARPNKKRSDDWFVCPHCGATVRSDAASCPECGSDDNTGWAEDADKWAEDIPTGYAEDDEFDYDEFVEKNRVWFKSHFPWVFEWQDTNAQDGVQVDYLELLAISGDMWQFNYPEEWNGPLTAFKCSAEEIFTKKK